MPQNITAIRNLGTVFSQVVSSHHHARRLMSKDDFGGDPIIQQMHCIAEAFGGNLFESIDRNGSGYNLTLSASAMSFFTKFMRDSINLIDTGIREQERAAHEYKEAEKVANTILNHVDDGDYPSPVEMVYQGESEGLKDLMLENLQEMTPLELDETLELHVESIISRIDTGSSMQSVNLLRDIIMNTIEPRLADAQSSVEEDLQAVAGHHPSSHSISTPIPVAKPGAPSAVPLNVVSFKRP